jgi:hypothetical protein
VTALNVLKFEPGREFDVVVVSFNPREGPGLASQKKAAYVERYGRPHTAAGWHFLTGGEASIKQLTEAIGFQYAYDDAIKQYAHGPAIEIVTPRGHVSKYFFGFEYSARDIRFALMEASEERIGTAIDQFLLLCYHYDPSTGKYGTAVLRLVRVGGIATMLAFVTFLIISLRRERQAEFAHTANRGRSGPSGGGLSSLPTDGGAHSPPASRGPRHAFCAWWGGKERSGAWGPRARPSRPASAKATAARPSASREGGGPGRSPD